MNGMDLTLKMSLASVTVRFSVKGYFMTQL